MENRNEGRTAGRKVLTTRHDAILQAIADFGVAEQQTVFKTQIEHAKRLGLMPDDSRVMRETLRTYGFVMQSSKLEQIPFPETLAILSRVEDTAAVLVEITGIISNDWSLLPVEVGTPNIRLIGDSEMRSLEVERYWVKHVWIRWEDGVDRSPCPRRPSRKRVRASSCGRRWPETESYQPFQPNPKGNYIGDCVVRAAAGAMDISWEEAVDLLSSLQTTAINAMELYPRVLESQGFVHCRPITRNGRRLNGADFCDEMGRRYRNGERIFAHVGRCHVAAIVPVAEEHGRATYKIIDSWDSSKSRIGDFWIRAAKPELPAAAPARQERPKLTVGSRLIHPAFGMGEILSDASGVLTVDFGAHGCRRLGETWVLANCRPQTLDPE